MAKKRYYQSAKDRMAESRGMERYEDRREMPGQKADKFNDEYHREHDERLGHMGFNSTIAQRANMNEFYAGMEPRRRQEMEDAGMIHEDQRAIANLPQEVMIKAYPKTGPYLPEGLDDTIRGVDDQMDFDDSQRRAHFYPKKV
jgi:hypothetical protein